MAAHLLERLKGDRSVVVVKRPAGIWAYRKDDGRASGDFYPQILLDNKEIDDSTGAGDVFAAGHAQFAKVTQDFIRSLDKQRSTGMWPTGVFVAHGANAEWLAVQRFVEERFKLPVYSFESYSWGGRQVTDVLSGYLERCSFAICVLTAEDFVRDGRRLARQNVIHEVGLFQGRHGFDRVLVLAEEGCDFVPQAAKPYTISFPHNGINRAFHQLDEMMRSLGFGAAVNE